MTAIQQFEQIHAEDIAMRDAGIEPTREQDRPTWPLSAPPLRNSSPNRACRPCTTEPVQRSRPSRSTLQLARNLIACLIDDITMLYPVTDLSTPEGGLWWADLRDPLTMTIVLDRAHCALECIDRDL